MIGFGGSGETNGEIAAGEEQVDECSISPRTAANRGWVPVGPYISSDGRTLAKINIFENAVRRRRILTKVFQDMNQAASGGYDAVYRDNGASDGELRQSDREHSDRAKMNGNWAPYSAVDGNTHNATTAGFICTFKRIAQIVRHCSRHTHPVVRQR